MINLQRGAFCGRQSFFFSSPCAPALNPTGKWIKRILEETILRQRLATWRERRRSLKRKWWIINDDIMLCNEIYDALFKKHLFLCEIFILHSRIRIVPSFPSLAYLPSRGCWGENNNFRWRILKCHNLWAQWDYPTFRFPLQGLLSLF